MVKALPQLNKIYQKDALAFLYSLPNNCIDMAITSPPYWCLRDYGVEGQLGLEPTFDEYINKLCNIFDEAKRVLKQGGSCWVNLGDTYSGNKKGKTDRKVSDYLKDNSTGIHKRAIITPKCLCQIPSRFAIEMCNRGWILRNTIIWHKPNAMPSSVKDRLNNTYEFVFHFVKAKKYYYGLDAIREPHKQATKQRVKYGINPYGGLGKVKMTGSRKGNLPAKKITLNPKGKNPGDFWTISTKGFKGAHFATYPEKLCEKPIKASCPPNGIVLDIFMGAGTTALVALKLGRKFLGCELNPAYIEIAEKRLAPYLGILKEAA